MDINKKPYVGEKGYEKAGDQYESNHFFFIRSNFVDSAGFGLE
jgi:hypothetical protein